MLRPWSLAQVLRNPQLRENLLQFPSRQVPLRALPRSQQQYQRAYFTFRSVWKQPQRGLGLWRQLVSRRLGGLRHKATQNRPSPEVTSNLGSPEPQTLSARLKKLSREYGWTAVGVYFALSALDFPFCFLAVRLAGTERIAYLEHLVLDGFWHLAEIPFPNIRKSKQAVESAMPETDGTLREGGAGWGVEEAERMNTSADASIWTQLALAYAIHKSFIFIRVPLTAAILPKVVKTLRKWGWDIGKRKPKATNVA